MNGIAQPLRLLQKFLKFLLKSLQGLHLHQSLLQLKRLVQSKLHLLVTWALQLAVHLCGDLDEPPHWFLRNDLLEFHQQHLML